VLFDHGAAVDEDLSLLGAGGRLTVHPEHEDNK
jgi:hypothetical protein